MAYPVVQNDPLAALWAVSGGLRETAEGAPASLVGPPPSDGMDHGWGSQPQAL